MDVRDSKLFAEQACAFEHMIRLIDRACEIVVCAHTSPDGDAIGSALAFGKIIEEVWPDKHIVQLLADNDAVPRHYQFLPGAEHFISASQYTGTPDLFCCLDLSCKNRLNDAQAVLDRSKTTLIIDHHPCDMPFGDVCWSRPDAAATGVLICEFALHLKAPITPDIAQCLLTAVMTDTGRFQYQNTDTEAFDVASMLVGAGAQPSLVSLNVYQSFGLEYLHLQSIVMSRIRTVYGGRIAYSYATKEDFDSLGVEIEECDGLVDIVRSVEGTEVALFLKEIAPDVVRGNLRSKGERDILGVAQRMGGGGHKVAAGFTVKGPIDEILAKTLPLLEGLWHETVQGEA